MKAIYDLIAQYLGVFRLALQIHRHLAVRHKVFAHIDLSAAVIKAIAFTIYGMAEYIHRLPEIEYDIVALAKGLPGKLKNRAEAIKVILGADIVLLTDLPQVLLDQKLRFQYEVIAEDQGHDEDFALAAVVVEVGALRFQYGTEQAQFKFCLQPTRARAGTAGKKEAVDAPL